MTAVLIVVVVVVAELVPTGGIGKDTGTPGCAGCTYEWKYQFHKNTLLPCLGACYLIIQGLCADAQR